MSRSFGQFVRPAKRNPQDGRDDGIRMAFSLGSKAARRDDERSSNPYMPERHAELWQAWNCGYDEESPTYTVART